MNLNQRMAVVAVVVVALFGALVSRLGYLQVVERSSLEARIDAQLVASAKIPTVRGEIYDRSGRPLVVNRMIAALMVEKGKLPKKQRPVVLTRLAQLLDVPYTDLLRHLDDLSQDSALPIPLLPNVRESAAVYIAEHAERFPGVTVEETSVRAYPNGDLSAHVLGYMGRIKDAAELASLPAASKYDERDSIGRTGVEQSFETVLRGKPGERTVRVDRLGKIVPGSEKETASPVPGENVYLTIDVGMQRVCEDSLNSGLVVARTQNDDQGKPFLAPAGAAVVLDLQDGSIVCSASFPSYSPQEFVGGISPAENARIQTPAAPTLNRAISGLYAPASTFKPFTAIAALADGLISRNTPFEDTGTFQLDAPGAQRVFKNAGKTPHGRITLPRAITVSSDTFFYWLGKRFWEEEGHQHEAIQRVARQLGLGEKTGVQLPNEKGGRVPDKSTKLALHEAFPTAFPDKDWRTGDTMNTAVGQGETVVTPLQIAVAYGALATGGVVITPKIALDAASVRALKAQTAAIGASVASAAQTTSTVVSAPAAGPTSAVSGAASTSTSIGAASTSTTAPVAAAPAAAAATTTSGPRPGSVGSTVPATIAGVPITAVIGGPAPATPPRVRRRPIIDPEWLDPVLEGMRGAVGDPAGTAYDAFVGFPLSTTPILGKTGTAQTGRGKQDNAVFAAFGPWPNPRYVVVVVMENSGFGGKVAAPVARRIFDALFQQPLTPVHVAGQNRD